MPSPLFSIWFILLSPFFTASLPFFSHNWENENFCVKWGLNEDHFSSLVLMRTKSSIEDLYARTAVYFRQQGTIWGWHNLSIWDLKIAQFNRRVRSPCHHLPPRSPPWEEEQQRRQQQEQRHQQLEQQQQLRHLQMGQSPTSQCRQQ